MPQSLADLYRGATRDILKTAGYVFTSFSVPFTSIKIITQFFPTVKFEGPWLFGICFAFGAAFGLKKVWKPSKIDIKVATTNTTIQILFGDIFAQDGLRAIAVTEFFDSKLGKPVSDKSLHGIFLKKCFGGHPESFDKQVNDQLNYVQGINSLKSEGKTKCYPIGTSALITVDQDRYLVFAFAKADIATCKAYCDVKIMWDALHQLWQKARIEAGGYPMNLPLVGSGLSGLGLPTRDLLNLIVLSAITETKAAQITPKIRIVLHRDRFDDLDLRDVKLHWTE